MQKKIKLSHRQTVRWAICLCVFFFSGCKAYRYHYFNKKFDEIGRKYNLKQSNVNTEKIPERFPKKRELDLVLYTMENTWALFPDSIITNEKALLMPSGNIETTSSRTDSIYTNKYKIEYILKHKLNTPGKILRDTSGDK